MTKAFRAAVQPRDGKPCMQDAIQEHPEGDDNER